MKTVLVFLETDDSTTPSPNPTSPSLDLLGLESVTQSLGVNRA